MLVHSDLQYYTNADAVTLALPNVAEGDLVLIIDYAHGGIVGGRNGDRLVPVPDTDWTSYGPGGLNGIFSSYARTWPAGGTQSLDLASEYASDRIVAVVVLRYASSDPNDWVFAARHTETVDQYFETPAATLPRSGYQVGFVAERAFSSNPVFSGTPFTTPTGLERLGAFDGAGVRLKGVLGGAPAAAGVIGGAQADAGEFRVGGGWEFTFGAPTNPPAPFPILDAPVTLHMSESLTGVFADPSIDATFFSLVDLPIGARHSLGGQISGRPWYNFTVRDKSVQGGLVSYSGETLLARLDRIRPTESLILVAGENGVPDPLTLREVLVRFLDYYGVPYDPDVPEFYLRVGDEILVPTVPAFAIQPDQENPESVYALLEPWWGVFRQYTFRADDQDRLKVTPPAWVDTIGARLNLWRRRQDNDRTPTNSTARVPWTTARRPTVEWVATVDGVPFSGALPAPLEHGAPIGEFSVGPITIRIQWRTSDNTVQASVWPPPPIDRTIGSLYQITLVLRPESLPGDEVLELTLADLDPADVVSASADTVINQVVIPHRERTFLPNQQLMQAGALVLRSPVQTAAGLFGNNFPYGPMAEELETPTDFLEIANEISQAGTWFWPVDEGVVIQPGGNVTVAYEVEEWAEMWGHNNVFSPQPAEEVNTHSGTVELPANGAEVLLFSFQFPRRTWATSIGGYQAQGRVYGRWRAGENPGVELRVGNSRFAEYGYLPEFLGIFGQNVYFLWGAVIKLNGTGTTFTSGDLHTYRFGFSRGEDGTWEGGANVPGLSESQALYPNRVYQAPELPYAITPEVGLALARGIVEENLTPKVVRTLTLVPARADGYAAGPWHMGRAVRVPALGVEGRLTSIDWAEAHTAQAQGDTSQLTIDIESTAAPEGSRAAATTYRRAAYGLSHYQQEE